MKEEEDEKSERILDAIEEEGSSQTQVVMSPADVTKKLIEAYKPKTLPEKIMIELRKLPPSGGMTVFQMRSMYG